jgi:hypothetical protein
MWNLWWTKWHWGRFSPSTLVFIRPISPQSPSPSLHCISAGSVANVSEVHAASILRFEVSRMNQCSWIYRFWPNRPPPPCSLGLLDQNLCIHEHWPPLHTLALKMESGCFSKEWNYHQQWKIIEGRGARPGFYGPPLIHTYIHTSAVDCCHNLKSMITVILVCI